ncbi:DUF4062 domain-containing protein [Amnibacterium endophyticum]|uniref:DUF4062 domain-containing protein n=1 Tax=Amnibacterium endophyticum TaxID=2109337 RepID=A0ABW4LI35_9MICO
MRVFISSVTAGLKDERSGLAALLSVSREYVPSRFEDFQAQDRSSRDACLAGVREADVYVLLLGPHYGTPFPDSGLAPTEEEFQLARQLDKPILVFVKNTDEADEPRQATFKRQVEDYVDGRFRGAFSSIVTLNTAVYGALEALPRTPQRLEWTPVSSPVTASWLTAIGQALPVPPYVPVLQVALLPINPRPMLASEIDGLPTLLARRGRATGFFGDLDGLSASSSRTAAWAAVPQGTRSAGWNARREHAFRGLCRFDTSESLAFSSIPTDTLGALVDKTDLTRRCSELLRAADLTELDDAAPIALAALLGPLDLVQEGDPIHVGNRTSGRGSMRTGQHAHMTPRFSITAGALRAQTGDAATEIAAELLRTIREN